MHKYVGVAKELNIINFLDVDLVGYGHLVKKINQGDNFRFPVGKNGKLGNKINISSSQTGTILWDVEYFVPNSTYNSYTSPLSYVNSNEYWTVSAPSGSQANMNLDWDAESDLTPLSTQNGVSDMRVAKYNTGTLTWEEVSSSASGSNSTGTVSTSSRITIPTAGSDNYTTACINKLQSEKFKYNENFVMKIMRFLLPAQRDNELSLGYLIDTVGISNKHIEWIAVRPDTLINEVEVSEYIVHPSPIRSPIFDAGKTSRINVADFMVSLLKDEELWEKWKYKTPVIYNIESNK